LPGRVVFVAAPSVRTGKDQNTASGRNHLVRVHHRSGTQTGCQLLHEQRTGLKDRREVEAGRDLGRAGGQPSFLRSVEAINPSLHRASCLSCIVSQSFSLHFASFGAGQLQDLSLSSVDLVVSPSDSGLNSDNCTIVCLYLLLFVYGLLCCIALPCMIMEKETKQQNNPNTIASPLSLARTAPLLRNSPHTSFIPHACIFIQYQSSTSSLG